MTKRELMLGPTYLLALVQLLKEDGKNEISVDELKSLAERDLLYIHTEVEDDGTA